MKQQKKKKIQNSNIKLTCEGKRQLGAAIGTDEFKITYANEKLEEWYKGMKNLLKLAKSQPHAAFSAFIHGEQHKFPYFLRILRGMNEIRKPFDKNIMETFLLEIFGEALSP